MKKLNITIWKASLVIGIITGIIIITFFTSQTKENGESKPKETNGEALSAVGTISGSWKKLANPPFPI